MHTIVREMTEAAEDESFPLKPQRIVWDLRQALAPEDIIISEWVRTKCGWVECFRLSGQTHASSQMASPLWESLCLGRFPRSSPTQTPRSWPSPAMLVS